MDSFGMQFLSFPLFIIYFIINTTIKIFLKLIPRLIIRTSYSFQTQKNKVAQYSIRRTPRKTKEAGMVPVLL